jgi:DNA-binding Xre family transcriptional regulator
MVAAERGIWTGEQLRRALRERAGYSLSSASISVLLRQQPAQVKLSTLAALCVALECEPGDLLVRTEGTVGGAPRNGRDLHDDVRSPG